MQSVSAVQLALHAVGPHTNALQLLVTGAGQGPPEPVQLAAAVATPLAQLAARQLVLALATWHRPPAAHSPVCPQGSAVTQRESALPTVIAAQVPFAAPVRAELHAMQLPPHALLQQKPSTHAPELH
jgi:hypothetical protein